MPTRESVKAPAIPDRIVKLVLEKKAPPPPPPPPPKLEEKKPEPDKKIEQPKPQPPKPDARERAQNAGLLKLQDQLADLRDNAVLDKAAIDQESHWQGRRDHGFRTLADHVESRYKQRRHQHRSLSRGYGGGAGALSGHIDNAGRLGHAGRSERHHKVRARRRYWQGSRSEGGDRD